MTPFLIVVIGFLILLPLVAWQDEKRLAKRLSPVSVVIERCEDDALDAVLEGKAVTYLIGTKEGLCCTPIAMIEYQLPPVLFIEKLGYKKYRVTNFERKE